MIVSGLVQGVFFRDTCLRQALAKGVSGWVLNPPPPGDLRSPVCGLRAAPSARDGTVEAVFQGAEADVAAMISWAHQGPRDARVKHVEVLEEPPEPLNGFEIRSVRRV